MIYLDSCAVIKLVLPEDESAVLRNHLAAEARLGTIGFTSELAKVEVHRALFRRSVEKQRHTRADLVLAEYAMLPLSPMVDSASTIPCQHLKTLDALQLASAQSLGAALTQFITYDRQLANRANEIGLPVVTPGA